MTPGSPPCKPCLRRTSRRLLYVFAVKRFLDIVGATLLILLLAVPMLVMAAWVRRDSQGNVIYRQKRVGYGRREFTLYKFRSMDVDADERLAGDPELSELYRANWKLVQGPTSHPLWRVSPKFSLDELPQLFNVIKGDMSLVGPRPYMPIRVARRIRRARRPDHERPSLASLACGRSRDGPRSARPIALQSTRNMSDTCGFRARHPDRLKTVKSIILKHGAF